jgi:DNA polymerase
MRTVLTDIRSAFEHHIDAYGGDLPTEPAEPNTGKVSTMDDNEERQQDDADAPRENAGPVPAIPLNTAPLNTAPSQTGPLNKASLNTISIESPYDRIAGQIPAASPLHTLDGLDAVADYVRNARLIDLDETRLNPVFGVGHPDADLMVIGEAPGADEDAKGEPFVGRAGKLLTQILQATGFERDDVYIANILKSRPPDNRPPRPDEIEAHVPILYKQIALIKPKVILCVGKTSGTSLLGLKSSLADMRSKFHDFHGLPVMVTYHPAALLRNPNWKRPTWEDMQQLRDYYKEIGGRPTGDTIVDAGQSR